MNEEAGIQIRINADDTRHLRDLEGTCLCSRTLTVPRLDLNTLLLDTTKPTGVHH